MSVVAPEKARQTGNVTKLITPSRVPCYVLGYEYVEHKAPAKKKKKKETLERPLPFESGYCREEKPGFKKANQTVLARKNLHLDRVSANESPLELAR